MMQCATRLGARDVVGARLAARALQDARVCLAGVGYCERGRASPGPIAVCCAVEAAQAGARRQQVL